MTARMNADDARNVRFKPPRRYGKRGYNQEGVDQLLDRVATRLEQGTQPPAGALTADDVKQALFKKPHLGRRGYDEDQVDAFLDRVVAELMLLEQGQ